MNCRRRSIRPPSVLVGLLALIALSGCGTLVAPDAGGPTTFLLVSNAGANAVEVLATDGRISTLANVASARLGSDVLPCGMALGPDQRLYVADRAGVRVLVFEPRDVVGGGPIAPVATITAPALTGACGVAFDAGGSLWLADQRGSTIARPAANVLQQFEDLAGVTGDVTATPSRTLELSSDETRVLPSWFVSALYFDADGALWFSDVWRWSVNRIDDPSSYPRGTSTDVVPDLQFDTADRDDRAASPMHNPQGLVRDEAGNLFVAMAGQPWVLRYDAASLTNGRIEGLEPAAVLRLPLQMAGAGDGPVALALDGTGALWIAVNERRQLFRIPRPSATDRPPTHTTRTHWGERGLLFASTAVFVSDADW